MATERVGARRGLGDHARVALGKVTASLPLTIGVVVVAAAARIWLGRKIVSPWIMIDELVYSELAKSFAAGGHYLLRGHPTDTWSIVYPALISPGWFAHPMTTTYGIAKVINAVLMTSAAIPLFLWASRLAPRRYALMAAVLLLLIPSYSYTGMLMTENAFLPTFLLAAYAIALALERPSLLRQVLALCAIGLASAVRFQGLVLVLVLPTAALSKLVLDLRAERTLTWRRGLSRLVRFWPSAVFILLGGLAYVIWKKARGAPLSTGFGAYHTVVSGGYSLHDVARWAVYHFAELPLAFAVIPASAFLVLLGIALVRGVANEAERSFLAVTAAATFWIVVEVAAFASRFSFRVEERYMFVLAPLFLVAFALWLGRGLPRPPVLTAIAAAVPALMFLALPLGRLLNISILSDTFGLIPFLRLSEKLNGISPARAFLLAGGALAALAFAFVPRRLAAIVLPAAMGAFFVLSSYSVHGAIRDYSRNLRAVAGLTGEPSWIDTAVGGRRAAFLFSGSVDTWTESSVLWQVEFWNRSVKDVYDLDVGEPVPLGSTALTVRRSDGRVVGTAEAAAPTDRYLVTEAPIQLVGRRVAVHPPLTLYRAALPLRVANVVDGLYQDGWTGADASFSSFARSPNRTIKVSLSRASWSGPDVPGHVRVEVLPLTATGKARRARPVQTWVVHSGAARTFTFRAPNRPFRVHVHVAPTFAPSQFGLPDTRRLGVQASFRLVPARGRR